MIRYTLILLLITALPALAEAPTATEKALLERIARLEARLAQVEQRVAVREAIVSASPSAVSSKPSREPGEWYSKRGAKLTPYGYIKLDSAYDTDHMNQGNIAYWMESEERNSDDNEYNMTVNQTRLGLDLQEAEVDGLLVSGKVEIDFYGGGAENKAHPRMRHAYLKMDWPDEDIELLAGQYWDVIASLTTPMLNFGVGGYAGNIGYRRPQLRLTKEFGQAEAVVALSRTIGDVGPYSYGDSGEDSGFPTIQARLGYALPIGNQKTLDLAISGHWGQEELDTDSPDQCEVYDTWSSVMQFNLPLGNKVDLMGEYFYGENLDAYYGGIGQGINPANCESITAQGGWLALRVRPTDRYSLALGAGVDDPQNGDLEPGMRSRNQMIFGNVIYNLTSSVQLGLEISHWRTDYVDAAAGEGIRVQSSLIYNF